MSGKKTVGFVLAFLHSLYSLYQSIYVFAMQIDSIKTYDKELIRLVYKNALIRQVFSILSVLLFIAFLIFIVLKKPKISLILESTYFLSQLFFVMFGGFSRSHFIKAGLTYTQLILYLLFDALLFSIVVYLFGTYRNIKIKIAKSLLLLFAVVGVANSTVSLISRIIEFIAVGGQVQNVYVSFIISLVLQLVFIVSIVLIFSGILDDYELRIKNSLIENQNHEIDTQST